MGRFLVGWEMGFERGHVAMLLPIVRALRERGHEVAIAAKDLTALGGKLDSLAGVSVLQAPVWTPPPAQWACATLGDDLATTGMSEAALLHPRARAWRDLIDTFKADVVLAEFAPTLLLAARTRCPAIAFGTAFGLPAAGHPIAIATHPKAAPPPPVRAREEQLRKAFDEVDRSFGGAGLGEFTDLFAGDTWVCNLAELDPYAELRAAPAPGPLTLPTFDEVSVQARRPIGENVFAYVKPSAAFTPLLVALAKRCRRIELFSPELPERMRSGGPPNVIIHSAPVDLARRIQEFTCIIHNGGLNTAAEALYAGLPQLVVPHHLEQAGTMFALLRHGVGFGAHVKMTPETATERTKTLEDTVADFLASTTVADRAAEVGAAVRKRQRPSLDGLVALSEECLTRPRPTRASA